MNIVPTERSVGTFLKNSKGAREMRYITAGESHGPQLTVILEGVPAGLTLAAEHINKELLRRQKGHGRGRRMQIETDTVEIVSGVRHGMTLGSPITLIVKMMISNIGRK